MRRRGGVREVGLQTAKDSAIWKYALQNNGVILTKDEDFAERCIHSRDSPIVVWLRIGNATTPILLAWFLPLLPEVLRRIELGDRLIEIR